MDADISDQQFRAQVRRWLADNLPADMVRRSRTAVHPTREDMLGVTAVLSRAGWSVPHWPVQHGGPGWSARRCLILEEELTLAGGSANNIQGVSLAGPVIAEFGTDAQKARHLPAIREGREFWAQGFSEPGAGSDLASLRTRAVREGDHYVVDGQKIWTSQAMYADMLFCLVRTDPDARPQAGITFLLIDMKSPGVTVRPIASIDEGESLCEVFLESVKVPLANRVGEEGKGWTYAKFLLGKERVQTAEVPRNKLYLARLQALAAEAARDGRPLNADPVFARDLAEAEIDLLALESAVAMIVDAPDGGALGPSALKIVGCELMQRLLGLQLAALGPYGSMWYPHSGHGGTALPPGPDDAPGVVAEFLFRRAATIYGGSSEIQKNIIAKLLFAGDEGTMAARTDEQALLADSAARFAQQREKERGAAGRRVAVPTVDQAATAWRRMCETGFPALGLPEGLGGAGGGLPDLVAVAHALGAGLADVPFTALAVLPGQLLAALAKPGDTRCERPRTEALAALLAPVLAGERVLSVAYRQAPRGAPLRARREGGQWVLTGDACMVEGAPFADRHLVVAHADDAGATLFVVDATASGLRQHAGRTIDGRHVADLSLQNVVLPDGARLGAAGAAGDALARALDAARVAACADALGAMDAAFRITRDYLAVRRQFGAPLASFQALQHRMAEMFAERLMARAVVARAAAALAAGTADGPALVAACAARVGRAVRFVANQCVQLHGGIGMTEEYTIGRHYKRLLAFTIDWADPATETRRFTTMKSPHEET